MQVNDEIQFKIDYYVISNRHISGNWCAWHESMPEDGPTAIGTLQEVVDTVIDHLRMDADDD